MVKYEPVIGLEIHAQLLTNSKAFSADSTTYGASPNTLISAITLAYPGTLPKVNKAIIECAIKMGLACNCTINTYNQFARKNYFYADLPKGYQISQFDTPICSDGYLTIKVKDKVKKINLTRIHMEEDSGKSIHDQYPYYSLIDLNRAGVALIEIVSEPDMRSSEEAYHFITKIRKLVRYLEICDGNMEEGSLRCDANISIRLKGSDTLGNKVEVKNMNSMRHVQQAIEYEILRQIEQLENGKTIDQDTRSFDAVTGKTFSMRSKEMAHDYRYFPEPDLPPVILKEEDIKKIKKEMPVLPEELFKKYVTEFGLSDYDASIITEEKGLALYYDELIRHTDNYKTAANWLMGSIKSYLNEHAINIEDFPVTPENIADLITLIKKGMISNSNAEQKIFPVMVEHPEKKPLDIAKKLNLIQNISGDEIQKYINKALNKYPDKIKEYKAGKHGLIGLFMGEVMKLSQGKADPKKANRLLKKALEKDD